MIGLIFFIFGLIVGSFLNVVIYRMKVAESIVLDRSRCPHCKKVINWYDNVPLISFVLLYGRCRKCKKKISWQYPLVELSAGIIFAAIGSTFFNVSDMTTWANVIYLLGISGALIVIFVYDFLYWEIPDVTLWPSIVWVLLFGIFFDLNRIGVNETIFNIPVYSRIFAASVGFAFFYFLSRISHEKWMGMGDAYLAILLGLILGWPQILLALFFAFFIGSVCGIILIAAKKKTARSQLPFAPFLITGTVISMLFYEEIVRWYFSLY